MIITVKDEYSKKRPEKPNNLYRFHLLICVIVYIVLNILIIYLSSQPQEFFNNFSKYTLIAILSQGQVLAVVFITLIPIKKGHRVAFLLCSISAIITLLNVLSSGTFYTLPGVIIPITSIIICVIINSFKYRQNLYSMERRAYPSRQYYWLVQRLYLENRPASDFYTFTPAYEYYFTNCCRSAS